MKNQQKKRRGFTLVELVIVMAVIAILAGVLIPTFVGMLNKAKGSADTQLAKSMSSALGAYKFNREGNPSASDIREFVQINDLVPTNQENLSFWLNMNTYEVVLKTANELNQTVQAANKKSDVLEEIIPGYMLLDTGGSKLGEIVYKIRDLKQVESFDSLYNNILQSSHEDFGLTKDQYDYFKNHIQKFNPNNGKTLYISDFGYIGNLKTELIDKESGTGKDKVAIIDNIVFADRIQSLISMEGFLDFAKVAVTGGITLPASLKFVSEHNILSVVNNISGIDTDLYILNPKMKMEGNNSDYDVFSKYLVDRYPKLGNLDTNARTQSLDSCDFTVKSDNLELKEDENGDFYSEVSLTINIPEVYSPNGVLMNDDVISQKYRYTNLDNGEIKVEVKLFDEYGLLIDGTSTYSPKIKIENYMFNNGAILFTTPNVPLTDGQQLEYRIFVNNGEEPIKVLTDENNFSQDILSNYVLGTTSSSGEYMLHLSQNEEYLVYDKNGNYANYNISTKKYSWKNKNNEAISAPIELDSQNIENCYVQKSIKYSPKVNGNVTTFVEELSIIGLKLEDKVELSKTGIQSQVDDTKLEEFFYRSTVTITQTEDGEYITNNVKEDHISYNRYITPYTIPSEYVIQLTDSNGQTYNVINSRIELWLKDNGNEKKLCSNTQTFGDSSNSIRNSYYNETVYSADLAKYGYNYTFRNPIYYMENVGQNMELLTFIDKDIISYKQIDENTFEFTIKGTGLEEGKGIEVYTYDGSSLRNVDYYDCTYRVTYLYNGETLDVEILGVDNLYTLSNKDNAFNKFTYWQREPYKHSVDKEQIIPDNQTTYELKSFNGRKASAGQNENEYLVTMYQDEQFNPLTTQFVIYKDDQATLCNANIFSYDVTDFEEGNAYDKLYTFHVSAGKDIKVYCSVKAINVGFNFVHEDIDAEFTAKRTNEEITEVSGDNVANNFECTYNESIELSAKDSVNPEFSFVAWYITSEKYGKVMLSTNQTTQFNVPDYDIVISCEYATNSLNNDVFIFTYNTNMTCKITWCNDKSITKIYIPSYSGNYKVTAIDSGVFSGCANLQSIYIPDTMESINNSAFVGTQIDSKNEPIYFGSYLYKYNDKNNPIEEYSVLEGTTTIGDGAFKNNKNLKIIRLPDSVKEINVDAFQKMENLEWVYVSENSSLTKIGNNAFYSSLNFKGIVIEGTNNSPLKLTTLGNNVFYMCKSLKYFDFSNIEKIGTNCFQYCVALDNVVLTNKTLTELPVSCFDNCASLANVTIGQNIVKINNNVFANCNSLVEITFPDSITTWGSSVLIGCGLLNKVTMPNGTTVIPVSMFQDCTALTEIYVGKEEIDFTTLTKINNNAFYSCYSYPFGDLVVGSKSNLTTFSIGTGAFSNCYGLTSIKFDVNWDLSVLPASVLTNCTNLLSANLGGATNIGASFFSGCTNLKTITGLTLTQINDAIFYNCTNLETAIVTDFTKYISIGKQAFYNCNKMNFGNIVIGQKDMDTVTIGYQAFYSCNGLYTVTINAKNVVLAKNADTNITGYNIYNCANLTKIVINSNTLTMSSYALASNKLMTRVELNVYEVKSHLNKKNEYTNNMLGERTFYTCSVLQEVVIPYTTTRFGQYCFNSCTVLANITKYYSGIWEDNQYGSYAVTTLDSNAITSTPFKDGVLVNGLLLSKDKTIVFAYLGTSEDVVVPSTVTTIKANAFANSKLIKNLVFEGVLTTINEYAFANAKFGSITFNQTTFPTTIAENALENINTNVSIVVPMDLTEEYKTHIAFNGLYVNNSSSLDYTLNIQDGILKGITGTPVSLVLPDEVTTIAKEVFKDHTQLKNIEMPNVTLICEGAFENCTALESITFDKVTTIEGSAFKGCSNLVFDLPTKVVSVGANAFNGTKITEIVLPETLSTIGTGAFNIASLTKVYALKGTPPTIEIDTFDKDKVEIVVSSMIISYYQQDATWSNFTIKSDTESLYKIENGVLSAYTGNVTTLDLSDKVITTIAYDTFKNNKMLKTLVLPKTITSIGASAFEGCTALTNIVFKSISDLENKDLVTIKANAFKGCSNLTTLDGMDISTVTTFENYAFSGCQKLVYENMEINPSVSMGTYVFQNCKKLTKVTINNLNGTTIPNYTFVGCIALQNVTIPSTITVIGEEAFSGCTKLTQITNLNLENVTNLNKKAFYNCQALVLGDIVLNNSLVKNMGTHVFYQCKKLTGVEIVNDIEEQITIPTNSFQNCTALTKVKLSSNVTILGVSAFEGCTNLKTVSTLANATSGKITLDYVAQTGKNTFKNCKAITEIEVNSTCNIGESTFEGMDNLVTARLKGTDVVLGKNAFKNCKKLTDINLESVKSYGTTVFANCTNLTKVDMGNSTFIASGCFDSAKNLVEVVGKNIQRIEQDAFKNCITLKDVKIDFTKVTEIGKYAFYNCFDLVLKNYKLVNNEMVEQGGNFVIGSSQNPLTLGDYAFSYAFKTNPQSIVFDCEIVNSKIPNYAFTDCLKLEKVYFNHSVTKLGANVFANCLSLIEVGGAGFDFANLVEIGASVFSKCLALNIPNNGTLVFGDSLPTLGNNAFYGVLSVKNVEFKNSSMTALPNSLFENCPNLKFVKFAEGTKIKTIGASTFSNCINLEEIVNLAVVENDEIKLTTVTSIGNNAFKNCKNLNWNKKLIVGANDQALSLGTSLFTNNFKLMNIEIRSNNLTILQTSMFEGCLYLESAVIPSTIITMNASAFKNCVNLVELKTTNIDTQEIEYFDMKKVTNIGNSVFENCISLMFNGNGVVELGNLSVGFGTTVFKNNYGLKQVIFTAGVKSNTIPNYTFQNCIYLEKVILDESIVIFNTSSFEKCEVLEGLYYVVDSQEQKIDFSKITTIAAKAFSYCLKLDYSDTVINFASTSNLGANAFEYCSLIKYVSFANNTKTTKIDNYVFQYCENLEKVTLSSKIVTFGNYSFYNCYNLKAINCNIDDNDNFDISLVTSFGTYCFQNCQYISSVTFNKSVKTISQYAFKNCVGLTSVSFADGSICTKIDKEAFYGCIGLRNITLPASINNIGNNAFGRCTVLNLIFMERGDSNKNLVIDTTALNYSPRTYFVFETDAITNEYKDIVSTFSIRFISKEKFNLEALQEGFIIINGTLVMLQKDYKDIIIDTNSIKFRNTTLENYEEITLVNPIKVVYNYCFVGIKDMINLQVNNTITLNTNWNYKITYVE